MLALTDAGLAHLFIAATRVPVERRGAWLADLAERLERPTAAALKQRAYRRRRAAGRIYLHLRVNETDHLELLIRHGLLAPDDGENRPAVEAATAQLLTLLATMPVG